MSDYALDLTTPVRHVATLLDGASSEALSIEELTAAYRHPIEGDLARVQQQEGATDAIRWLIERAVSDLDTQVVLNGNGYSLTRPFEELKYQGREIHRKVAYTTADEKQELRTAYWQLLDGKEFRVRIGKTEPALRVHPFAHAFPLMGEQSFLAHASRLKAEGVGKSLTMYDNKVLIGRHILPIASVLGLQVQRHNFKGTDDDARAEVLKAQRGHPLNAPQRALIVREVFLPAAESIDAAVKAAGMSNSHAVESLAPIDNAPRTKRRVRRGSITTDKQARHEALAETYKGEEDAPIQATRQRSATEHLGRARAALRSAREQIEADNLGSAAAYELRERAHELEEMLTEIQESL